MQDQTFLKLCLGGLAFRQVSSGALFVCFLVFIPLLIINDKIREFYQVKEILRTLFHGGVLHEIVRKLRGH